MKYCGQCGKQTDDDAGFCQYCGYAFSDRHNDATVALDSSSAPYVPSQSQPESSGQGIQSEVFSSPEPASEVAAPIEPPLSSSPKGKGPGGGKKVKIIIASILALVLLAAGGLWGWQNFGAEARTKSKLDLGIKYLSENDYEKAVLAFDEAIKIDPKEVRGYQGLAKTYTLQGKYDDAKAVYERGTPAVNPESQIVLRLSLAGMYIDKGDLSQAESFFQEIINGNKSCIEAYVGLAQVYRQRGIKEKAQAVLEQAVKDNSQDYRAYNALARFMTDSGDKDKAFTNLVKSLDLEVNQQEAYSILTALYKGRWADLAARSDAAASPKTAAMLKFYAYLSDQKYSQALSHYHDKLQGDQSNLKAQALAAVIMCKQGSSRDAESLVANLLKNKSNQGILMDIARYYITAGSGSKAADILETVVNRGQYTDLAEASQLLKELASQSQGEKSYQLATRTLVFNSKPIIVLLADLGDVLPSSITQAGKKLALNEDADWTTVAVPLNAQVWEYYGSTSFDKQNDNLVLTAPVAWQEGRIWLKKPVKPPFKVSFEFRGGGGNGEMGQADGLVFMFNKDKNYSDEKGGSVGFGSSTGYGVEFDSFNLYNGQRENSWDPIGEPHIALLQNSYKTHLAYTASNVSKDDQWHKARINVLQDQITVWVDEQQVLNWQGTWNGNYSALGFAAATGRGNDWHLLKNFSISTRTGVLNLTADELQIRTQQEEYLDSMPCAAHGTYFYINSWKHSQKTGPFEDINRNVISRGIGIFSDSGYNSGVGYAEYDISTRRNCRFEADLGLEKVWNGSHGSTTFIVKADGKEVYRAVFKDNEATRHIAIPLPPDTKRLRLEVDQVRGSTGTHGAIWGNARIIQE